MQQDMYTLLGLGMTYSTSQVYTGEVDDTTSRGISYTSIHLELSLVRRQHRHGLHVTAILGVACRTKEHGRVIVGTGVIANPCF